MKYYNPSNHAKNLPDYFKQTSDSNNFKILELERYTNETLRNDLRAIEAMLSIDEATGTTLDFYGERIGQQRGIANDVQYRLMLKAKIMRSLTTGTYDSIINAVAQTFNCQPTDVILTESIEPCVIEELTVPLKIINEAGLSSYQTHQIVKSLLPVAITLNSYVLEGTFSFADNENEYDEDSGFALIENAGDADIGGYFGEAGKGLREDPLPIS